MVRLTVCLVVVLAAGSGRLWAEESLGFRVPPGFEVSLYAGDDLAHNIFSMTTDAQGRIVVAGPKYVKILHDDDQDGRADRATLFSDLPASGAHGMYFDGPDLICTGDNGLLRLADADGDGAADGPPQRLAQLKHPEHGANGVVCGPDGWYYVICGNDAGVSTQHVQGPGSPVKTPRCGAIVRFAPEGGSAQVVAHGYRNPYDVDFSPYGNLLTVDADGERDYHLPWYAPTRLFDVMIGREHGWLLQGWQRSWNRPQSFLDAAPRLYEIGRGSPTGLLVYRHHRFPPAYRGCVFSACWSMGKIYSFRLRPEGDTFAAGFEVFMETTGNVGFAPVDLTVDPKGDLFVAIGGRGTRGGVFRVRAVRQIEPSAAPSDPLRQVLDAPQPLSSWSRARWVPAARSLGREPFETAVHDPALSPAQQIRAVEILTELFGGVSPQLAQKSNPLSRPEVLARIAWSLGRTQHDAKAQAVLAELTGHAHPWVARAAWEALAEQPRLETLLQPPHWTAAAASPLRRVRSAMLTAAQNLRQLPEVVSADHEDIVARSRCRLARQWLRLPEEGPPADVAALVATCLEVAEACSDHAVRLEAVRLLQRALGDVRVQPDQPEVYSGYSPAGADQVPTALQEAILRRLAPQFPSGDDELDRELARLLGMIGCRSPGLLAAISEKWTTDTPAPQDIHYLIVMSRLPGERSSKVTQRTAAALAQLHEKLALRGETPSRNWPLRVGEAFDHLAQHDPGLPRAMLEAPSWGRPEHSLFVLRMTGSTQQEAARRLLAAAVAADDEQVWSADLVRAVAVLEDDEIVPVLREQFTNFAVRDAVAVVLARRPRSEDRLRLVEALGSPQGDVVGRMADALRQLPPPGTAAEIAAALHALRQACLAKPQQPLRQKLVALLEHWSGQQIEIVESGQEPRLLEEYRPWFAWFEKEFPAEAGRVQGVTADSQAWRRRLEQVSWQTGDAQRGKTVFERKACHLCHRGAGRLGPDLTGAAARFSRHDLFVAMVEPSRDVSPLYRTTMVVTTAGQVHHGLLIYESPEATLLQTGPDTTLRFGREEVQAMLPGRRSLMPDGLLNDLSDGDLADLYAYLKTLAKP